MSARGATRRAGGSSARSGSPTVASSGSAKPPASSAALNPRGSSNSASGLPRVSATMRSRTRSSSRPGTRRVQQRACITVAQAADRALRQPVQLQRVARLAHREHQCDRLREQPPRDERQDLRRDPVEPLRVVDQADQRPLLGDVGQQAQHRQTHQEAIGGSPATSPNAVPSASRCGPGRLARRGPASARTARFHRGLDGFVVIAFGRVINDEVAGIDMLEILGAQDRAWT